MAKIGTLLEKLFKKVGIEINEEITPLFSIDTEVSEDVFARVDKSLLTIDAAKNNQEVIRTLRANALNGVDIRLDELIAELGLQPNEDFLTNKNTFEKISIVTKLANETGKKAAGSGNKQTADEFAKKEADYNLQIKQLKDSSLARENDFTNIRENDLTTFELKTILGSKNYIFPAEMDTNLKLSTALGAVQNELNKKGFSIKRTEAGQLTIVNKEGQPAYSDNHEALEPNTFIDGALAQNKLLKINDPKQLTPQPAGTTVAANGLGNAQIVADLEAQIALM